MEEIKSKIAILLNKYIKELYKVDIDSKNLLELPKDEKMGDLSMPCFRLSNVAKKSPIDIANEIKDKFKKEEEIKNIACVNGYLNFEVSFDKEAIDILNKSLKIDDNKKSIDKTIVIDYSSPNIAKPFHLGHFRNTVLGSSIYKIYKELGYNVVGINYLGDWGRQFGLLIEGYNRFKDEYDFENNALDALCSIYVRINQLAKEDDTIFDKARENFLKLEEGDKEYLKLWEHFRNISLEEYNKLYKLIGCNFDSYNGEAFYNDKMDIVIKTLEDKKVLKDSEGAKVVYIPNEKVPCIILKSNGSSIYATRDLAAIMYRSKEYNYDKAIYITAYEQKGHFKQVFEVAKHLVNEKYQKGLMHVYYGMVKLKSGKMSTRDGNVITVSNILDEVISKSKNVILEKNVEGVDVDKLSKEIGISALIFSYLKNSKVKDIVFDIDEILRFDGETGPYVQYTYIRTLSILNKENIKINTKENNDFKIEKLDYIYNKEEIAIIKLLDLYNKKVLEAAENYEPSIIAKYLIDLSKAFSVFYNNNTILHEEENIKEARLLLVMAVNKLLKKGMELLGMSTPEKM